ncbi:hypothetical protein MXD81_50820 [Microbacteriaceae bacterium K1510]|nr:hypothetical protein [Microbacteriaceae bacterium K1510]
MMARPRGFEPPTFGLGNHQNVTDASEKSPQKEGLKWHPLVLQRLVDLLAKSHELRRRALLPIPGEVAHDSGMISLTHSEMISLAVPK